LLLQSLPFAFALLTFGLAFYIFGLRSPTFSSASLALCLLSLFETPDIVKASSTFDSTV